jgi:starch phosphorylase
MARLAPRFSTSRMMGEYVERLYLAAAHAFRRRSERGGALARELASWSDALAAGWARVRFGEVRVSHEGDRWRFEAQVHGGGIAPDHLRVELFAEPTDGAAEPLLVPMAREEEIPGTGDGWWYRAHAPASRAASDYTARVVPCREGVRVPIEARWITWQR